MARSEEIELLSGAEVGGARLDWGARARTSGRITRQPRSPRRLAVRALETSQFRAIVVA
jgi:hypothetical protein